LSVFYQTFFVNINVRDHRCRLLNANKQKEKFTKCVTSRKIKPLITNVICLLLCFDVLYLKYYFYKILILKSECWKNKNQCSFTWQRVLDLRALSRGQYVEKSHLRSEYSLLMYPHFSSVTKFDHVPNSLLHNRMTNMIHDTITKTKTEVWSPSKVIMYHTKHNYRQAVTFLQQIKMSSSFADGAEVPVTEAALPRWTATLRRWKRFQSVTEAALPRWMVTLRRWKRFQSVTEAALPCWTATLRRWKRKATERGSEVVAVILGRRWIPPLPSQCARCT